VFSRDFYEFAVLREVWIGACRKIEAAGSSFAGSEFRDAHFDASPPASGFFVALIQRTHSQRAMGVMFCQSSDSSGALARAL
jgi:hypothetical protein